jgi:hypothetical protein
MPTIVVSGSARNAGKTSLICGVIAELFECSWTAIKISAHDHLKSTPVWEETQPGQGTDTARYLAAGARRALLATAHGGNIPTTLLKAAIANDPWLIFETNRIQSLPVAPDIVLALIGLEETEPKSSFAAVVQRADAFVCRGPAPARIREREGAPVFVLPQLTRISPEMARWLRAHLGLRDLSR